MVYQPKPIDTAGVELPKGVEPLREILAANAHDVWAVGRIKEGWTYGEKRNDDLKLHPDLVPYDQLTDDEKEYDRKTSGETLKVITKMGYRIMRDNHLTQDSDSVQNNTTPSLRATPPQKGNNIPFLPNGREALREFYGTAETPQFPLYICTAGHCRLDEAELAEGSRTRREVSEFFRQLAAKWTRSSKGSPAPIVVFSCLAEGADFLIAEELIKVRDADKSSPLRLAAVLPYEKGEFEASFEFSNSQRTFRDLYARANIRMAMPNQPKNQAMTNEEWIENQHRNLARYFAENSAILLALWDGKETTARGGTFDIVNLKINGIHSANELTEDMDSGNILPNQPIGTIFQIQTARRGETVEQGTFFVYGIDKADGRKITQEPQSVRQFLNEKTVWASIGQLAEVNWNIRKHIAAQKENREKSAGQLCIHAYKDQNQNQIVEYLFSDEDPASESVQFLLNTYTACDTLAQIFQKIYWRYVHVYTFFLAMMLGTVAFAFYGYVWNEYGNIGRILSIASFAVLFCIHFLYPKSNLFYHRFRAIAEGLRVQIFWQISGISRSVMNEYWNHQVASLDSLRLALKAASLPLESETGTPDRLERIDTFWVQDQRNFFQKKIKDNASKIKTWSWLYTGIMTIAILWLSGRHFAAWSKENAGYGLTIFFLVCAMSGVWLSVLLLRRRCFGFFRLKERYEKIVPIFSQAHSTLKKLQEVSKEQKEASGSSANIELQKKVLQVLGTHAVTENADWYLHVENLDIPTS